jgi:hypothetical protein
MRGFRITGAGDGVNPGDYATIRQLSSGTFAASFASLTLPGTLTVSGASTLAAVTANSLTVSGTTTTQELAVNDRAAILEIDLGHSQSNRQGWFDGANGNGSLNGNFYVGGGLYVSGNRLNVYGGSSPGLALINTAGGGPFAVFNSSGNLGFGPADGNGNPTAFWGWFDGNGNFGLAHNLNVSGSVQLAHLSVSDEIYSTGNNAGFQFADRSASGQNWAWYATSGSARLWLGSDRMWVDSSGNLTTNGGATFNGYTTASDFRSNQNVYVPNGWVHAGADLQTGTTLSVGSDASIGGNATIGGTLAVNNNRVVIQGGNSPCVAVFNHTDGNCFGMWNASANLQWGGADANGNPSQTLMRIDGGGSLWIVYGDLHVAGNVYATNVSDRRLKSDIVPWRKGLDLVRRLQPVSFQWNGRANRPKDGRAHIGLVADEVEQVLPEAVSEALRQLDPQDADPTPVKFLDDRALICALVNAVQQLAERLDRGSL